MGKCCVCGEVVGGENQRPGIRDSLLDKWFCGDCFEEELEEISSKIKQPIENQ
jgi:hypothetical protein